VVKRFLTLSWIERGLLLEASLALAVGRLVVLLVPFRRIASLLGEQMAESSREISSADVTSSKRISWAISAAARHLPWDCRCLVCASATMIMLSWRRIPATFYLGVSFDDEQRMLAHAWVRAGEVIITGCKESSGYTVVATFATSMVGG
jgi:hypothetical protein